MFGKSSILLSSKMSAIDGFQDDADWSSLSQSACRSDQQMKTDLRLQRLVGKAQSPIAKMLVESFPSSFWIFATSCALASGGNIFSIWIVEKIEVDGICKRIRSSEPIPSMNRTRNMFRLYIRHHAMRTTKTLKSMFRVVRFWIGQIAMVCRWKILGELDFIFWLPSSLPTSSTLIKSYGSVFQSDFGTRLTRKAKPTCS